MSLCPTPRKGCITASGPSWIAIDTVSCKRWKCDVCGKTKAYLLRSRMEKATYNRFITLTHHPRDGESPDQALRAMRQHWHLLQRHLSRREAPAKLRFVCIVEWTKAGQPHLHILYHGKYIAQKHLSRLWKSIHGAPIVDIRKVSANDKTAAYLTKYLTKDNRCPPRMRRWSSSRGFLPELPPYINPNWPEDTKYAYSQVQAVTLGNQLYRQGWTLLPGPSNTVIAIDVPQREAECMGESKFPDSGPGLTPWSLKWEK